MSSNSEATLEAVAKYRKSLYPAKTLIYGDVGFILTGPPSVASYLDFGKKYANEILNNQFGNNTSEVYRSTVYSYYKTFAPWITSAVVYGQDDKVDVTTSDTMVIASMLDDLQLDDAEGKFLTDIEEYIASTEVTHICYPAVPCQQCGHTEGSYVAVDPILGFFTQSVKRLQST